MRKSIIALLLATTLSASFSLTAFAAWEQQYTGTWRYENNGTYYNDGWHWIDGNHDNIAECYYFGTDGIMLSNTITPDNFTVNTEGAWIVNGIVQTRIIQNSTNGNSTQAPAPAEAPTQAPAVEQPAPTEAPPVIEQTEPAPVVENVPDDVYYIDVPGVGTIRSDDPRAAGANNFHNSYDDASDEAKKQIDNAHWQ